MPNRLLFITKKCYIIKLECRNISQGVNLMITELRKKSQITIPKDLVEKLGLKEGDKLEIFEKEGVIHIMPVVVYSKKYIYELKEEILDLKAKLASGEQPVFDSVEDLFKQLDSEED